MSLRYKPIVALLVIGMMTLPAGADEIRLKDGKKLFGVIVAYEENMFKVKTDFGYVLVEKDKIASIIPSTPAKPAEKTEASAVKDGGAKRAPDSENVPVTDEGSSVARGGGAKTSDTNTTVKPHMPAIAHDGKAEAPAIKDVPPTKTTALVMSTAIPAPPKDAEPPAVREEVQNNLYTNYTNGFRMYKAPSWQLIDDARNALPNAIVAMGASNESTLLVVGREKTQVSLEAAASAVEGRLHEVYENYRQISRRNTVIGGSPAIEFRYQGSADEHPWSGTLVVIGRGNDIFTVLGMTYADSDLIQIQENVIARAIASLDFHVQ